MILSITVVLCGTSADNWSFVRRRLELFNRDVNVQEENQWLPNSAKIGRGYNLAKGAPVCYTGSCQMSGFARPIFQLNYTQPTTGSCINKLIPENVDVDCLPSTDISSSTEIISTLRQLQESTMKGIDITTEVSGGFGPFSTSFSYTHSEQTRSMIDTIIKENSTVLFTTLKISWVRLSLFEPKIDLTDNFRFVIQHMPCCDYNAAVEEYVRKYIINYFGYAYVHDLLLGGIAQQRIVISEAGRSKLEKNGWTMSDEASISFSAGQIFSAALKIKTTDNYDKAKLDTFSKYSQQSSVTTLGGDISLQSFEEWSKTIKTNPIIVKFGVSLIFDLLTSYRFPTDPKIGFKAQLIRTATEMYLLNPLYCFNQCTDATHGTCIDSGYFQFGTCKCYNGWTGLDCSSQIEEKGILVYH
ncbi:unnamed protein product [Rotaria sp. Silwood2]|nr:unnamed protein product [Rotaria sp. Silwood2]